MKQVPFKNWIGLNLRQNLFFPAIGLVGLFVILDLGFTYYNHVESLNEESQVFVQNQIKNLQLYDYGRVIEELQTFSAHLNADFSLVTDPFGQVIGTYGQPLALPLLPVTKPTSSFGFSNTQPVYYFQTTISDSFGNVKGKLLFGFSLYRWLKAPFFRALILFLVCLVLYFQMRLAILKATKTISQPIEELSHRLAQADSHEQFLQTSFADATAVSSQRPQEIADLDASFRSAMQRLQAMEVLRLEAVRRAAFVDIASQVAHDIRSPLSALDIVMRTETSMPEEKRILARSAITRITDIANNLLEKNKRKISNGTENSSRSVPAVRSIELLASLIDSLMSEKRIQFRSRLNIELEYQLDVDSYGLFANINPIEFKRVLSNLINNSVEALPNNSGKIYLKLSGEDGCVIISIVDNGTGIPAHLLPKLGQQGASFGKEGTESGSGRGLFHARQTIESFGGKLEIKSVVGEGTTIKIILPKSPAPAWFVEKLELKAKSRIVVADDDSSIHQIWDGRFDSAQVKHHGIEVAHFSTPSDLGNWFRKQENTRDILFLVDYEFLGQSQNGLDIIKALGVSRQSILVTSRYEEPQILQTAQNMGVRMIPKGMAGLVPISFVAPQEIVDAVLIDDDVLVHMTWSEATKDFGKVLKTFFKPDDFFSQTNCIQLDVNIYIDENLGAGIRGEDVARRAHDLGFENIYLATGYEKERFSHLTFLKGVIGKDPPWVKDE